MELLNLYKNHIQYKQLIENISNNACKNLNLSGLTGSSASILTSTLFLDLKKQILIILPEFEEAAYFYSDLTTLLDNEQVLFFPSSYKRITHNEQIDQENIVLRSDVLSKLSRNENNYIVVSYAEAIAEKVIVKEILDDNTLKLFKGENISIEFIHEVLYEYGFELNDFVFEPGQFSVRGGIVDVFSYSNDLPYRIEFFGDTVESIRSFEIDSQLSKDFFDHIAILPDIKNTLQQEKHELLFSYYKENLLILAKDLKYSTEILTNILEKTANFDNITESSFISETNELLNYISKYQIVEFGVNQLYKSNNSIAFNTSHQPLFQKNFELLTLNLIENYEKGYQTIIVAESHSQIERLQSIFHDIDESLIFEPLYISLNEGFIDHDLRICCYTDHQIFERYHKYTVKKNFTRRDAISIQELTGLMPGDYIVHVDHGVGIFGGLEKIEINGKWQETVRLVYKDKDVLYVNIHSLHKISKFKSKDGEAPHVYKLGTGTWQKLKQNTKRKIQDIAKELISLYAKRKQEDGFSFSPDSYLQKELEASFIYEDTPDQANSSAAVKKDMESPNPMDRLVCGDVGFGKTEIAVRAAFKAVTDGKQVAVLVPTTILALQHFKTFSDRLKNFPCTVDYVSRLKGAESQRLALKGLKEGKVDILIGTHRIVSKDVQFKDLGLLIIDEEQKFGVAVKDKLKHLKVNIDTLTLTATPIPRTLQFSMMGARDLSVINTPPPNRHPIITELHVFNDDIIREAIMYEVNRGGQVFFIHNRVMNIEEIAGKIKQLCPKVNIGIAHGQMDGKHLEKVMLEFISGDFDVLVATSIIESGLDIPNANTIFIHNAQNFGLSDLHQLRGRVGRSNKKAFCYLLAPPISVMTPEARRRLKAIEEYSELGSGFHIALQDLDIRGAGNLLGAEQSGFIADIGYETYHKILDEAIQELREGEFKDFYQTEEVDENTEKEFIKECAVETDMEILFPEYYIQSVPERIKLYRKLDEIKTEPELEIFEKELFDRFGKLPQPALDLLNMLRIRWKAVRLGMEKIVLKNQKMVIYFIVNPDSDYYKSTTFKNILNYIQAFPKKCQMKEIKEKLTLIYEDIENIDVATSKFEQIYSFVINKNANQNS